MLAWSVNGLTCTKELPLITSQTPTDNQFRPAVLRVLLDCEEQSVGEIVNLVADEMHLSEAVHRELIPAGRSRNVISRLTLSRICSSGPSGSLTRRK